MAPPQRGRRLGPTPQEPDAPQEREEQHVWLKHLFGVEDLFGAEKGLPQKPRTHIDPTTFVAQTPFWLNNLVGSATCLAQKTKDPDWLNNLFGSSTFLAQEPFRLRATLPAGNKTVGFEKRCYGS